MCSIGGSRTSCRDSSCSIALVCRSSVCCCASLSFFSVPPDVFFLFFFLFFVFFCELPTALLDPCPANHSSEVKAEVQLQRLLLAQQLWDQLERLFTCRFGNLTASEREPGFGEEWKELYGEYCNEEASHQSSVASSRSAAIASLHAPWATTAALDPQST